ncbi:hypothetical protein BH11MYX4_BH11MYX4_40580 [soil metagenome]
MNARYLLGIALATAAAVAACGGGPESGTLDPGGNDPTPTTPTTPGTKTPGTPTNPTDPATPGNLPTNSATGKDFFTKNVAPILETKCSGCHAAGGTGNPTYIAKGDASKTYDMVYLNGFATATSRILVKGVHSGGSGPELSPAEKTTFTQWIAIEVKDGGAKTQTNVLEKFGSCFDKTKFDAIGFGQLRTVRRQNGNNPQNQTENANNCTGCDNKPCSTCHASDDVTGFVMAIGNPNFPADYTFEQSKKFDPAFIRQYASTTPTGQPQYNPGVMNKSTNTVEKGMAYSHPMFKLTPAMEANIKAFVDDAVTKYTAGTCGK